MNRSRALAATLAIAGAALLAPTVASADPYITATANGTALDETATGVTGNELVLQGHGCDNSTGTAVMGEFVSPLGDPAALGPDEQFQIEMPVDEAGDFTWTVTITPDNPIGMMYARWYCAPQPVTSLSDPSIVWAAPVASIDIQMGDGSPARAARQVTVTQKAGTATARTSALRSTGTAKTAASTGPVGTFKSDPDALPLVDKVAIPGPKAASLKKRVDADVAQLVKAREMLARLLGKSPMAAQLRKPITSSEYVTTAYVEVTGKLPTKKALADFSNRLETGRLKVQVVEDIALTSHDAAWWIKQK